ncbi:MAG: hypothetical protein JNM59_10860 [Hyphomonadaceae bacterium]|nr:hypothetical protein [Hyphomonadaceae bacterium]
MKTVFALIMLGAVVACSPAAPPAAPDPAAPDTAAPYAFTAGDPPATPAASAGSADALGSGCAPNADTLPDGAWFGYATRWDAAGIDFDLACFYVGDAAAAQATAHNEEFVNDYYLVNNATTIRRLDVAANATAYRLSTAGGVALERTTYADLVANPGEATASFCPGELCAVWVFVNDGRVTEVMQQFFP